MKSDLMVAIRGHLSEIAVPRLARIETKLFARLAGQEVPGAFDIAGGERASVMPFDALAQWKGQLGAVLGPRPAGGEIGHNRLHIVLSDVLVEHDEVVDHLHH